MKRFYATMLCLISVGLVCAREVREYQAQLLGTRKTVKPRTRLSTGAATPRVALSIKAMR